MNVSDYGPFAEIISIAAALFAVFSTLALKSVGRVANWTWLVHDAHPFMIKAGARAVAVALIAFCYLFVGSVNHLFFAAGAVLFAVVTVLLIARFNTLRSVHIHRFPKVGANGSPLTDARGNPVLESVVIGEASAMQPEARKAWDAAVLEHGGLSLADFMAGYGARRVNDPKAIWPPEHLASINNRITMTVMGIVLCGVMTLYLAALSVDAHLKSTDAAQVTVSNGPTLSV